MPSLPISNVRQKLFGLVQQVNDDHDPLTVVTKSGENAVLVAESDWNSLMETLYVLQTHGGVHLLKSAQDARDGITRTHALMDPEAETPEAAEESVDSVVADALQKMTAIAADLGTRLGDAAAPFAAPLVEALQQLTYMRLGAADEEREPTPDIEQFRITFAERGESGRRA